MGCTALDEATEKGHEDVCSVLFGRGALRLTLATALQLAAFHNNIVAANALLAKGADVNSANKVCHDICRMTRCKVTSFGIPVSYDANIPHDTYHSLLSFC
jgi:hypothetical protein